MCDNAQEIKIPKGLINFKYTYKGQKVLSHTKEPVLSLVICKRQKYALLENKAVTFPSSVLKTNTAQS
jgi:hypothetical protein